MPSRRGARGFTYVGLLIFIALIGIASAAALTVGTLVQRRSAEEELLFVGAQFRNAFRTYAMATPAGQPQFPNKLEDLVLDPRFPKPVRHLRKVFADPITGKADWTPIPSPVGGIMGVSSASDAVPLKIGNFSDADRALEGRLKYSEWAFFYSPSYLAQPARKP